MGNVPHDTVNKLLWWEVILTLFMQKLDDAVFPQSRSIWREFCKTLPDGRGALQQEDTICGEVLSRQEPRGVAQGYRVASEGDAQVSLSQVPEGADRGIRSTHR